MPVLELAGGGKILYMRPFYFSALRMRVLFVFLLLTGVESYAQSQAGVIISKDGVGPVRVGQNYTISEDVLNKCKLPESCVPLYDELSCDRDEFSGDFEIIGRLEGAISLLVFCDEEDQVRCFTVVTDQVKTKDGLSTASTASEILAAGGKVQNMPLKENNRVVGYHYRIVKDGLYFLFGPSVVTGGKVKPDAKPYGISNTLFGGVSEDELAIM